MTATVAARLADFALTFPRAEIPAEVLSRARIHFLDTLGCGIAAAGMRAGGAAPAVAAAQGGRDQSTVIGSTPRVPAALAALANGTLCHALDFDDTHERGICHSSTVVAPAALAMAEACDAELDDALVAYVVGGEAALRIAVAGAEGLYDRGFHPTGVCGAFGATAAAARLLGMDLEETTNAFGVVGSFASGLFEYLSDGSATKPLHAGWAAQAGIQAALLARAGATGPATVVEGRFGVLRSHTGDNGRATEICEGLGARWEVLDLSIKAYPACHFAHSSTWAAGELVAEHGLRVEDIEEVVVRIPSEGQPLVLVPSFDKARPRTPYDAKFSLPFTVAHRIVHGDLALEAFEPGRIADPAVLALARRVRSEPIEEPAPSRFAGGARVITRSGARFDRFVEAVPGSPGNPLSEAAVLAKFHANAALGLPATRVERLAQFLAGQNRPLPIGEVTAVLREVSPE